MLTRAKIAYNLHKTPYKLELEYEGQKVTYHFSSELYRIKFNSRCGEHRRMITESLSKRFGFTVKSDLIADLRLYATIEKRGYLISIDGEYTECQNDIILDGMTMTLRR